MPSILDTALLFDYEPELKQNSAYHRKDFSYVETCCKTTVF